MPSTAENVSAAFLVALNSVTGIVKKFDHEPRDIPGEKPALTMVYLGASPVDLETGPHVEMTHEWIVLLYLDKPGDARKPQLQLMQLLGPMVQAVAADQTLGNTCDRARLDTRRFRPDFDQSGYVLKESRLYADLDE